MRYKRNNLGKIVFTKINFVVGFSFGIYLTFMFGNVLCMMSACFTRYPNVAHKNSLRVFPYVILFLLLLIPCVYK